MIAAEIDIAVYLATTVTVIEVRWFVLRKPPETNSTPDGEDFKNLISHMPPHLRNSIILKRGNFLFNKQLQPRD